MMTAMLIVCFTCLNVTDLQESKMEMQQDAKPVLEVWVLIQHFAVDIKSCHKLIAFLKW